MYVVSVGLGPTAARQLSPSLKAKQAGLYYQGQVRTVKAFRACAGSTAGEEFMEPRV